MLAAGEDGCVQDRRQNIKVRGSDLGENQAHAFVKIARTVSYRSALHDRPGRKCKKNRKFVHLRRSELLKTQLRQPLSHFDTIFERLTLDDASTEPAGKGITNINLVESHIELS